jgi:hypothetical protein
VWSRNIKRGGLGPIWAVALQQEKWSQNDRCITGLYNYMLQRSIFKFQRSFSTDFSEVPDVENVLSSKKRSTFML